MVREFNWTDQEDQGEGNEGQIDVAVSPTHPLSFSPSQPILSPRPLSFNPNLKARLITPDFLLSSFPFLSLYMWR